MPAGNPGGLPVGNFNGLRKALLADRAQLFRDLANGPFFGYNRPGAKDRKLIVYPEAPHA